MALVRQAAQQKKNLRFRFFVVFGLWGPFLGPGAFKNEPRMKNRVGWTPGGVRGPILSGLRSGVGGGGERGVDQWESRARLKMGPRTPPGVRPTQFFILGSFLKAPGPTNGP